MVKSGQAGAIKKKGKEREETADKLVERKNRRRCLGEVPHRDRSLALKNKSQLRPESTDRQQKNHRADRASDMIGHDCFRRTILASEKKWRRFRTWRH